LRNKATKCFVFSADASAGCRLGEKTKHSIRASWHMLVQKPLPKAYWPAAKRCLDEMRGMFPFAMIAPPVRFSHITMDIKPLLKTHSSPRLPA
jgi:hypothetical protein